MGLTKQERAVRKGDVSSVFNLIAQFAHETFEKLPLACKSMWTVEDLIAHGVMHTVTYAIKEYKGPKYKNAQFITYLYVALSNLYKDLLKEAYRDKRTVEVYSMDSQMWKYSGKLMDLYSRIVLYGDLKTEDRLVARIDAEKAFLTAYEKASPKLRKHLIHWCIQPKDTKYKTTGMKFRAVVKEFKKLGLDKILTASCIRTIQTDSICRNKIVIATLGLSVVKIREGRTIKHSTTGFNTPTRVRKNSPSLEDSLLADALV